MSGDGQVRCTRCLELVPDEEWRSHRCDPLPPGPVLPVTAAARLRPKR